MKQAFTLSEVLITLGIVGIVAALTIPGLLANYRKKVLASRLKKVILLFKTQLILLIQKMVYH